MLALLAFAVSLLALGVAVLSALYSRRQAVAVEDANWDATDLRFEAAVDRPHSGAAQLRLVHRAGPPLDALDVELLGASSGPMSGFGAGTPDGLTWAIGEARVGQEWSKPIVQRPSASQGGPAWQEGSFRLRLRCRRGRHRSEVSLEVELPPQPWAY